MRSFMGLGLLVLVGCEPEGSDIITPTDELPDLAGTYDAEFSEPEGCEAYPEVTPDWLTGTLVITGEPEALTFAFGDADPLEGAVDAAFTWEASGTATTEASEIMLFLEGLAFIGDETWNLDGDVTVDRLDSTGRSTVCTLTGLLEASQVP